MPYNGTHFGLDRCLSIAGKSSHIFFFGEGALAFLHKSSGGSLPGLGSLHRQSLHRHRTLLGQLALVCAFVHTDKKQDSAPPMFLHTVLEFSDSSDRSEISIARPASCQGSLLVGIRSAIHTLCVRLCVYACVCVYACFLVFVCIVGCVP